MSLERRTRVDPGYDCRVTCKHKRKAAGPNGHGIHYDEWIYMLIDAQAGAALELRVSTPNFPATVDTKALHRELTAFRGLWLHICTRHPAELALIRDPGSQPRECDYLGHCYTFRDWSLLAEELVRDAFITPVNTKEPTDPQPKLWAALETFFAEQLKRLTVARQETGDLGWQQCNACAGKGVTPKSRP